MALVFPVHVMSVSTGRVDQNIDQQGLCGRNVTSTAVDKFPCRTCFLPWLSCHSVTDTT